jgi:hypothetical protein
MSVSVYTDTGWNGLKLVVGSHREDSGQKARILSALGLPAGRLPHVDDENLFRYYEHLSRHLRFPFTAYYPEPKNRREETLYECEVLELLDPSKHILDEFDGIFCKARKGRFEVNLPLVELDVPPGTPNSQRIEDYWHWFWNWR